MDLRTHKKFFPVALVALMAAALMVGWHVNPVVSRVVLNGSAGALIEKDRTTVTGVAKSADGLSWTQLDEALPLTTIWGVGYRCD